MLRDTAEESLILDFVAVAADVFNPSVLWTPPLSFAAQNTEEEGEMYFPFASASILYVIPRNTAGDGRGRGLKVVFLCFNSLALLGISLYIVTEILGEWG